MNYSLSYHKLNLPNLYIQDPTSHLLPGISFLFLFLFFIFFFHLMKGIYETRSNTLKMAQTREDE